MLHCEFHGDMAEVLHLALSAETTRQRRAAWREHREARTPMPSAGQLRARALMALIRRGLTVDYHTCSSPRTEAILVITADDPTAQQVRSLDGEPVTADIAELLTCDAHLQALIVDQHGQPLWLGRSTRLASAAQRRALAIRDGGCVFPGCDMPPSWCDAHHQSEWEHAGATNIDTMALLCRRHHGTAHTRRWTLQPVGLDAGRVEPDRRKPGTAPAGPDERSQAHPTVQRFEWHDHHTGHTTPAQQRGLR